MKYFKVFELVNRETYDKMGDRAIELFTPDALAALDGIREYFGAPVTVNNWHSGGPFEWRGWRTLKKAAELGAPKSAHARGEAFDCDIQGVTAEEARQRILDDKSNPLLLKITRIEANVNWLHFDVTELPYGVHRIYVFTQRKQT